MYPPKSLEMHSQTNLKSSTSVHQFAGKFLRISSSSADCFALFRLLTVAPSETNQMNRQKNNT